MMMIVLTMMIWMIVMFAVMLMLVMIVVSVMIMLVIVMIMMIIKKQNQNMAKPCIDMKLKCAKDPKEAMNTTQGLH